MTWVKDLVVFLNDIIGQSSVDGGAEPFGHDIGDVFSGGDVLDCEAVVVLDLVLNPVVFDVHVARTLEVHDGSVCDVDCGLVVAEDELLVRKRVFQLLQERAEPVELTGAVEEADVLGFHGGTRDTTLSFGGPTDRAATQEEDVA